MTSIIFIREGLIDYFYSFSFLTYVVSLFIYCNRKCLLWIFHDFVLLSIFKLLFWMICIKYKYRLVNDSLLRYYIKIRNICFFCSIQCANGLVVFILDPFQNYSFL